MGVQLRGDIQRVEEQSPFSAGLRRCRPGHGLCPAGVGAGGSGDSCRRLACWGSPRLRMVFPLDQADSLSHPHITERVFSFDLDPLFPRILFSKRRRTLQDPPQGQGSSVTVSHPLPAQIWRSARTLCATLSLHWTALWMWTSTAVQRYLAGDGPSLGRRR